VAPKMHPSISVGDFKEIKVRRTHTKGTAISKKYNPVEDEKLL